MENMPNPCYNGAVMLGGDEYGRKGMERPESKTEAEII